MCRGWSASTCWGSSKVVVAGELHSNNVKIMMITIMTPKHFYCHIEQKHLLVQEVLQEMMKTLSGDLIKIFLNWSNNNNINVRKENSLTSALSQDDGCLGRRTELIQTGTITRPQNSEKPNLIQQIFFYLINKQI